MDQNADIPQIRTAKVARIARVALTPSETIEIRRLFDLVADTCDAASELLAKAGPSPVGPDLLLLRNLRARAEAMLETLKTVLA
jgi:hypothetical protein